MAKELEQRAPAESATATVTRLVPIGKLSREARRALRHRQSPKPAEASTASDGAATVAPRVDEPALPTHDLRAPELYLNRELSWLQFNRRVLNAAQEPRTPLLERVKFLAIVSSNLDEFFMKRIGGLKQRCGRRQRGHGGWAYADTADRRLPRVHSRPRSGHWFDLPGASRRARTPPNRGLQLAGIAARHASAAAVLHHQHLPLVTPLAMDPAHPFPFISNLSLNPLVSLQHPADHHLVLARVKVPVGSGVPRFLKVVKAGGSCRSRTSWHAISTSCSRT